MPNPPSRLHHVNQLLLQAEGEYTPQAYARALAAIEDLPDQQDPEVRFRRAAVRHAMAEFRGDVAMLREAVEDYEAVQRSGIFPRPFATLVNELIAECYEQIRDGEAGRHGWKVPE